MYVGVLEQEERPVVLEVFVATHQPETVQDLFESSVPQFLSPSKYTGDKVHDYYVLINPTRRPRILLLMYLLNFVIFFT